MGWRQVEIDRLSKSSHLLIVRRQVRFCYLYDASYDSWHVFIWTCICLALESSVSACSVTSKTQEEIQLTDSKRKYSATNRNIAHAHYLVGSYKCVVSQRFPAHLLLSHLWFLRYQVFNGAVKIVWDISADIARAISRDLRSCAPPRFCC